MDADAQKKHIYVYRGYLLYYGRPIFLDKYRLWYFGMLCREHTSVFLGGFYFINIPLLKIMCTFQLDNLHGAELLHD